MLPRPTALLVLVVLAGGLTAQVGTHPELTVHHSFPEAGATLRLVVEGFEPGSPVAIHLDASAEPPPSLVEGLMEPGRFDLIDTGRPGVLTVAGLADERGLLALVVPLDDPRDAGGLIGLRVEDGASGRTVSIKLLVQPPVLLVAADEGLARIDLRDGRLLRPVLPAVGGLRGAALSDDGFVGYVLRDQGRLEVHAADRWGTPPRVRALDPAGDDLAHAPGRGPAFVIVRTQGTPFAPRGRLLFLDERLGELVVDPLGEDMAEPRWVVTDDGLTAFVAEDDLLVREIDLITGTARGLFTAGVSGDRSIADLAIDGERLLVLTRRPGGRPGSVTVLDLETGRLDLFALPVDPLRLVVLEGGTTLVVHASDAVLQLLDRGVPLALEAARTVVLDATAVPGGALLLVRESDGEHRLLTWDPERRLQPLRAGVPAARRVLGAGQAVAILLGAPGGEIFRVELASGLVERIDGVRSEAGAPFAILP